jgi:hypothetical protein
MQSSLYEIDGFAGVQGNKCSPAEIDASAGVQGAGE